MSVDLDAPTRAALAVFGEVAQTGETWTYTPQGGTPFQIDGVFDEAWSSITIKNDRFGIAPVSTTKPCLLVRLADFPSGVTPQQGGGLVRGKNAQAYTVADVNQDGFGCAHLPLNESA